MATLDGKTAVITGANRGIGFAIATALGREGARCMLAVRNAAAGEAAAERLARESIDAEFGVADVSDAAQVATFARHVLAKTPHIDILVNNAGIYLDEDRDMPPSCIDFAVLQRTLATNLFGAINMCKAFVPHMRRGARIINVSSGMGQLEGESDGYAPAYSISKTALNAYTQSLAAELKRRGIMVDCFDPGWVKTDMGGPGARTQPHEAAQTAMFLATRPLSEETGRFWRRGRVIPW